MELENEFSVDSVEEQLVSDERLIAMLRARQLVNLELLDRAQTFTADGARNLSEWTAQKLDVGLDSARQLVRTMRRTDSHPFLRKALADGLVSFDRAEALAKLQIPVESEAGLRSHLDVAGVRRLAADQVQLTVEDEIRSAEDRFLVMQPNLDESWWSLFGGLDGITGSVVDNALTKLADELPEQPDGTKGTAPWRKATALYELASGGSSPTADISLLVDVGVAAATDGRAGVRLEAGPRVGAQALAAVLCDSTSTVIVNPENGVPLKYGRSTRQTPPALSKAVLATTGGHCAIDGCNSRYRVEAHHIIPWSEGGTTDPDNLLPVCWFHHHIAIHERRLEPFQHPDHRRWRLRRSLPGAKLKS